MTKNVIDISKLEDALMFIRCLPSDDLDFPTMKYLELFEPVHHVGTEYQEQIDLHYSVDTPSPNLALTDIKLDPEPSTFAPILE